MGERATRLGGQDPLVLHHARSAAKETENGRSARRWLTSALKRNPRFSPLHAPRARDARAGHRFGGRLAGWLVRDSGSEPERNLSRLDQISRFVGVSR